MSASTPPAFWKLLLRIGVLLTLVYAFLWGSDRTLAAFTPQITDYQYSFTGMPPNDEALLRWGRSRPGIELFEVHRLPDDPMGNLLIRVRSKRHITPSVENVSLPAPFQSWGYRGGACMITDKSNTWVSMLPMALDIIYFMLAGVLGLWWTRRSGETTLPLFAGRAKTVLATSLGGLLPYLLIQVIARVVISLLLHQPHWDIQSHPLLIVASHQTNTLLFIEVLLGPLAEECFFRAFVFGSLAGSGYVREGYLVSSLLFAAVHAQRYNVLWLIVLFFLSIILVWSYRRSENICAPFCIHAINNGLVAVGEALR